MLTPDQLLGMIFLAIVFTAAAVVYGGRALIWLLDRRDGSVKHSSLAPYGASQHYVTTATSHPTASTASRPEAEAEGRPEAPPEVGDITIQMSQKALQDLRSQEREAGMVQAFKVFQERGLIPAGQATELKRTLFAVSGGGRQLQRLNAAIDAVQVPPPEVPPRSVTVTERGEQRELRIDPETAYRPPPQE